MMLLYYIILYYNIIVYLPARLHTYLRLRYVFRVLQRDDECLRMRAHFIKSDVEKRERVVAATPCIFFDTLAPPRLSFESVLG
jgi:hypothetical protein